MNAPVKPAHHELGASARGRWGQCPGSVKACRGRPNRDSAASLEGTHAHEVGEARLLTHLNIRPVVEPKCTPEMDAYVQEYADYCAALALGADVVAVEHRINLTPAGIPGGFGTADFVSVNLTERVIHIADLKYGKGVRVTAEENDQLELYGIGTYYDFEWVGDIDTVKVHVVQPRLGHFDVWEFDVSDIPRRVGVVDLQAEATKDPKAPRIPGEKQCRWCLAKADCPALAEFTLKEVTAHFENLEEELAKASDPSPVDSLTDEQVARAYAKVGLVTTWSKAITGKAFDLAVAKQLPGYKIVAGQGRRVWDDSDSLVSDLEKAGYGPDDFAEQKILSPAALEKRLGKKHEVIAAHCVKKEGNPTLAAEWDKRPAIDVGEDVMKMFSDETTDD